MSVASLPPVPSLCGRVSEAEWQARIELAACYRLVAREGWDELLSTHISARVPDEEGAFLINPYGLLFGQINASSLIKVDYDGKLLSESPFPVNPAAIVIHGGVLQSRLDVASVVHLHTPAGVAVSTHRDGLLPLNQRALYFQPVLGYHDYEGLEIDFDARASLIRDLGDNWMLLLRNHGTLTVGRSIGQAWVYTFLLERACQSQVATLAGGIELTQLSPEVRKRVPEQATHFKSMGRFEWPALVALLDREDASYRE